MSKKKTVYQKIDEPKPTANNKSRSVGQYGRTGSDYYDALNAQAWAELAEKWAIERENTVVEDGEFSSKHHAIKSKAEAINALTSASEALQSELSASASELVVIGIQAELEGLEQELRDVTDLLIADLEAVGITQVDLVTAEGEHQLGNIIDEGNTQTARAKVEADRSEAEADRSEDASTDLDSAIRSEGTFDPAQGILPTPTDATTPSLWFSSGSGNAGGIDFNEGDMLYWEPTAQTYYRVAGELTEPGEPGPIEILDDLIMQKEKVIMFRRTDNSLIEALKLDLDGDLILGDEIDPDTLQKLGLAADELWHILEIDEGSGQATEAYKILTEQGGDAVRVQGNQVVTGTKTFSVNPISTAAQSEAANSLVRRDFLEQTASETFGKTVHLDGDQTVSDVKTFTSNPRVSSAQGTNANDITKKSYVDGLDGTSVKLTGAQVIAGGKTFSSNVWLSPAVPASDGHATRRDYVDAANEAQDVIIGGKATTEYVDDENEAQDILIAAKAESSTVTTLDTKVDNLDNQNVKLSGVQDVTGAKRFLFPVQNQGVSDLDGKERLAFELNNKTTIKSGSVHDGANDLICLVDANDVEVMVIESDGAITIEGVVTDDKHIATKKYVDDNIPEGGVNWGGIGGTLANQTDLMAELNSKVGLSGNEFIGGTKTFTSSPEASNQGNGASNLTRKDYVDVADFILQQQIDGLSGGITLKGETTVAALNALGLANDVGDLWSMTDGGTLTQGGNDVLAGDQVAWSDGLVWIDFGGAAVQWGGIQGTLSEQVDLQAELDTKATTTYVTDLDAENFKLTGSQIHDNGIVQFLDRIAVAEIDYNFSNTTAGVNMTAKVPNGGTHSNLMLDYRFGGSNEIHGWSLSNYDDVGIELNRFVKSWFKHGVQSDVAPTVNADLTRKDYVDAEVNTLEGSISGLDADIIAVDDKYDLIDLENVKLTGAQSISGDKTFLDITSFQTAKWIRSTDGANRIYFYENDSTMFESGAALGSSNLFSWRAQGGTVVMLINSVGNLSILEGKVTSGSNTEGSVQPTAFNDLTRKDYVDGVITGKQYAGEQA